ncbi:MAG: hypothetical protein U9Q74_11505 [Gemmatimonadota bacterium]|nr:hypothetical protein [Gemmatimonadota bacterium]
MPDTPPSWTPTAPDRARSLVDARLQLHYAAQFATALGISYLHHEPDDSHTNLGWNPALGALVSHEAKGARGRIAVGVQPRGLDVVVVRDGTVVRKVALPGQAVAAAADRIRDALKSEGLDARRYTLDRHYELPPHPVAGGEAFRSDATALDELARWFGNAAIALGRVAREVNGASEVRVWPHHFDIATLVSHAGGKSNGLGLEPGDAYYGEPYFYVNASPQPRAEQATATLAGGGSWHTREWVGAVLPGSRVTGDARAQEAQVAAFLDSALAACRALVGA